MAKKQASETDASYENLLELVEKKLEELEGGELSLENSLKAYEEGVGALRKCYGMLKRAEGKIEMLTKTMGEPELEEYDVETGSTKAAKPKRAKAEAEDDDSGKSLF